MRHLPLTVLCGAFGIALSGCHSSPPRSQTQATTLQAQGKQVFEVGCAHCHVENTDQLKPAPPDLRGLFTRRTMPDGEPATDAAVEHLLMTGKGRMPPFAYQMSQGQMAAVIAYLHVYGTTPHK